jgi:ribosomal protein S18 acetylase RimI-like enzyme
MDWLLINRSNVTLTTFLTDARKIGLENLIQTTRGTILIRQAIQTDVDAFRELRLEALRNHPEMFGSDYAINLARPQSYWEGRLNSPDADGTILFATHAEILIGMCGIQRGDSPKGKHSALIWGVYVKSQWRGLNLSETLITNAVEWAQEREVKVIKLAVVTTNTAAIRCYARCGFTTYGTEPQAICFEGVTYDELLMARIV